MKRALLVATGIMAAFGCSDENGDFDDRDDLEVDVVSCEEAYARLAECCPGFDPEETGGCVDHAYKKTTAHYCSSTTTTDRQDERPSLSHDESLCIRERSCGDLIEKGICDRGQRASRRRTWSQGSRSTHEWLGTPTHADRDEDHPPVCP